MTETTGPDTMKTLAPHDRPRERLERVGVATLGDHEVLALLVGHGTARASAVEVAARILTAAGGIHGLTRLSRDDLASVPGVGAAVASRILAGVELGRRTLTRMPGAREQLLTPRDVARVILPLYGAYPVERFGVVLLDARARLIRTRLLTVGSLDVSLVQPRDVYREAMLGRAASVVVFHNHPSGDPTPSEDDVRLTRRLLDAGRIMGVDLADHLILADSRFYSFKDAPWFPCRV